MIRVTRTAVVVGIIVALAILRPVPTAAQTVTLGQLQARVVTLEKLVATLQGQIGGLATEAAARQAADNTLQANINVEAAARSAADTALQTNMDNEAAARGAAVTGLQSQINDIPTVPQNLLDLANYVSVDPSTLNDVVGPHVIFSGANVHIQNGRGFTAGLNGLGNFIVGYDEQHSPGDRLRNGSHNVVVGTFNGFSSLGGLVVGANNIISGAFASVSGGADNTASGVSASIGGGHANIASGENSSVNGGQSNTAGGYASTVSGRFSNDAAADLSLLP